MASLNLKVHENVVCTQTFSCSVMTPSNTHPLLLEHDHVAGEPLRVLGGSVVGDLLLNVRHDLVLHIQAQGTLFLHLLPLVIQLGLVVAGFLQSTGKRLRGRKRLSADRKARLPVRLMLTLRSPVRVRSVVFRTRMQLL